MTIIGWESEYPVINHQFNQFLSVRDARLHLDGFDLTQLFLDGHQPQGFIEALPSPLEIVYLPIIRRKISTLQNVFAQAIQETNYGGDFQYVYASKANAAEEVIRTILSTGANYELSSAIDVEIALIMKERGYLSEEQTVIINGFKPEGSWYAEEIVRLKKVHDRVVPIVEDFAELPPLINSRLQFDVGLRQKCYGSQTSLDEMDNLNVRFGLSLDDIHKAAQTIAESDNLQLTMYHAMVGGQLTDIDEFIARLRAPMKTFAKLQKQHPSLNVFNFGGGLPVAMTLDFEFDYHLFARKLLTALQEVCAEHDARVPDVVGEIGRYTVAEHGAHIFKIITAKDNGSKHPWYIIDGSIMSSFPDSWALGEHFILLPLNHWDKPFRQVQLGGITCDGDDIYPQKNSNAKLYLPVDTDELYVGFFNIGAYQEMLGGAGGSKHCVIPEATEMIIDRDPDGSFTFEKLPGQNPAQVLRNLGYGR
jgi:arginine decarboxylase